MLSLQFQGNLDDGSVPFEAPVGGLMALQLEGEALLLAATEAGGGLVQFDLGTGALAQVQDWQLYGGGGGLSGVELLRLDQGGESYVLALGPGLPTWEGHALSSADGLGESRSLLPSGSAISPARSAVSTQVGSAEFVFALGSTSDTITAHRLQAGLQLGSGLSHHEAGASFTALASSSDMARMKASMGCAAAAAAAAAARLAGDDAADGFGAGDGDAAPVFLSPIMWCTIRRASPIVANFPLPSSTVPLCCDTGIATPAAAALAAASFAPFPSP